ncbi:peptide/nickel transport system permease protein [Austwickia chelonae]|uniref:Putative ABC transporter permease/ATP-binding protein n=1 Tax=Austwickia chelonae NBRC 105200 TaxID=1184607 RepID=K6VPR8_9MICO|nr:dipeptide/oligopeptide/nickel ABC transporter permease/ATP-binding protein [Austwickia chelonae]GAB78734.1 putative ABC transporter permease/ATP-binding protein [Austwickia chelonae NBRC 105200]SEW35140.1 peptide/nickel transport system permease protein [Austwickia chelonae]
MRSELTSRLESSPGARLGALRTLPRSTQIALGLISLIVLMALAAPLVAGDPLATGTPVQAPGGEHLFGTDAIGRDVFARVIWGARSSLIIGIFATLVALVVAAVLGSVAATGNRIVSEILMRLLDIVMSFPGVALAAVFVAVFGNSVPVLVLAIGFLYVPQLSRVIRANVLDQFGEDYVAASRVMGARVPYILAKHVARNCIAPILVFATVLVADAIVFEASLSFINAGVKPPEPSWGNILSDGKQVLLGGHWWPTFFPGLMILITVLALNVLAEGLTDAMASPVTRKAAAIDAEEKALEEAAADANGVRMLGVTDERTAKDLLSVSLSALRTSEMVRTDRLQYTDKAEPILRVENLSISFPSAHGDVNIVDNVSFEVRPGETMGLVGESGCGKSITSMAIMGLLPYTAHTSGRIMMGGENVLELDHKAHNQLRGHHMAMVYQDALSSLNPSMVVRRQLTQLTRRGGTRTPEELMELVGLDPKRTLSSYPHELSGGQRQRVLIAMALTRNPQLIIADEPTTALDVTVQQQVVDLLNELREQLGFAMVFVSHDLALVAQLAHRITVMYAGQVVEQGATRSILTNPRHEYTQGLLGSVLSIESGARRLYQVPGTVPSPAEFVQGDRFAPRSSHPTVGLAEKPRLHKVSSDLAPDVDHVYATTDALEAVLKGERR